MIQLGRPNGTKELSAASNACDSSLQIENVYDDLNFRLKVRSAPMTTHCTCLLAHVNFVPELKYSYILGLTTRDRNLITSNVKNSLPHLAKAVFGSCNEHLFASNTNSFRSMRHQNARFLEGYQHRIERNSHMFQH
jgi:hypothetical protein